MMTMKKQFVLLALIGLLGFSACQKKNVPLFRGDYSFKTSGVVTLKELMPAGSTEPGDQLTVSLLNEIGQLEISAMDHAKDSVVVVMNTMGGEVVVTQALCRGNEIFLRDFKKNTLLFAGDSITLRNELNVSGSGRMYEDNTLIINMVYDGEAESNDRSFRIHGEDIRLAAIRN